MPRSVLLFGTVALAVVWVCQALTYTVEQRLARHEVGGPDHAIVLSVEPDQAGVTPRALIAQTFPRDSRAKVDRMADHYTKTMGGEAVDPDAPLAAHDLIRVDHRSLWLVEDVVGLEYSQNENASFDLDMNGMETWEMGLIGLGIFLASFLGLGLLPSRTPPWTVGLALVGAGSASNAIDRLWRGHVVDYVVTPWVPPFNLADVLIGVGGFTLAGAFVVMSVQVMRARCEVSTPGFT